MGPAFDDTIAAIATPLGEAGLGVVRISGPAALTIAERLFEAREPLSGAKSHSLHHGWITRAGQRLDEAVAGVFRAPTSYTGENVVEFSCHGSPAVLRELLAWCCDGGARLARPGEFTERAYLNGRMDLAQAEAVASLIAAKSASAATAAAVQLAGGLSARIDELRRTAVDLLADLEANLDFSEEDIPNIPRDRVSAALSALSSNIEALLSTSVRGRLLREGGVVVLAGRPNVGKSSLFNAFLAEQRAIVTDIPGTTRDTLEEQLSWEGYPVVLIDTAGLRKTSDPVEFLGAERARWAVDRADVVVLVLDASQPLTEDDRATARELSGPSVVVALNKSDRPAVVTAADVSGLGLQRTVAVSAFTRAGLPELRSKILSLFPTGAGTGEAGVVVTNERHAEKLGEARGACENALDALAQGRSEEAVAADLRRAAEALAAITGADVGEAVLDSIFRRFCIGK
jgi:tRNA modification GTPase